MAYQLEAFHSPKWFLLKNGQKVILYYARSEDDEFHWGGRLKDGRVAYWDRNGHHWERYAGSVLDERLDIIRELGEAVEPSVRPFRFSDFVSADYLLSSLYDSLSERWEEADSFAWHRIGNDEHGRELLGELIDQAFNQWMQDVGKKHPPVEQFSH